MRMARTLLRGCLQRLRREVPLHPALPAAALLGALACADGDMAAADYPPYFPDGTPGAAGALYRPLRPATTPGLAGASGVDPTPGSGGAPGVAGAPGFTGTSGAGGTLGVAPVSAPGNGNPYGGSAGMAGSYGY